MKKISKNFELRYISHRPESNGETDFKGETSTLTTRDRIDFLNEYARLVPDFFEDFSLTEEIVTLDEARIRLKEIKPQPGPAVRQRIVFDKWKWLGCQAGARKAHIPPDCDRITISEQNWRCFIEFTLKAEAACRNLLLTFGRAVSAGFDGQGGLYYIADGKTVYLDIDEKIEKIKFELDFVYRKWNLYVNDSLAGDYVDFSDKEVDSVCEFTVPAGAVSGIWGVGYYRLTESSFEPFRIETFIDEDFSEDVDMNGWQTENYDDSKWRDGVLPIVHGGERCADQDIYMRRKVVITDTAPYAELYLESLTPGGEVYINGRLAAFIKDECCKKIDVSDYVKPGENLFAVRVYADKVKECDKMTHTNADLYTGWFAGRMHLDLLPEIYIDDVFSYTENIGGDSAVQRIRVAVKTLRGTASARAAAHEIAVKISPWFPREGKVCACTSWVTKTAPNILEVTEGTVKIPGPALWTADTPNLYQITVSLKTLAGEVCDDYVITTGIRTVSQEGGIFRINGKPELLRAPLLFGSRPPLEKIAAWEKCPPAEYYIQEIMMLKKMNGNGFRMSVHDERMGGINDPRICEFADQMGVMLVWQTTTWLRITSATNIKLDELKTCITQVRNHSSIIMWQPTNHPSWKDWDTMMSVYHNLYDTIIPLDPSRLISPSADFRRARPRWDDGLTDFDGNPCSDCDPIWRNPVFCRGNMDYILGYGNEWSALREWPEVKKEHLPNWMESSTYISSYINSPDMAYFNFEHDEIIGQPCWQIHRGKPEYHIKSYEKDYDEGSIGRELDFDEWLTSQAWQALGAYETIKKNRWLDYDGLCWCNLRGGQNSVTYQKSLIDYYGQPKLAYYIHRMAFQNTIACSKNVDMVYGPEDRVPVIVMNIGDQKTVNVTISIVSADGQIQYEREYENVILTEGRSVRNVGDMEIPALPDGLYCFIYQVVQETEMFQAKSNF